MRLLLALVLALGLCAPALAVNPNERLDDPALEARARELSQELRCVVCQNQTIDDSDAAIAQDLRLLVRERLTAGDTDAEVMTYLTDRYGDFVRLRPPLNAATLALWALPLLVLLTRSRRARSTCAAGPPRCLPTARSRPKRRPRCTPSSRSGEKADVRRAQWAMVHRQRMLHADAGQAKAGDGMDTLNVEGALGAQLAARIDRPEGPVRAVALFAHCFTCGKDIRAARIIARRLADNGIATVRFDFTGLGGSEGEFASTHFSSNVGDLVKMADALREGIGAPRILIGHSLGGAAVLVAAAQIPRWPRSRPSAPRPTPSTSPTTSLLDLDAHRGGRGGVRGALRSPLHHPARVRGRPARARR